VSRIAETFQRCKDEDRTALMPYLTIGYPDLPISEQVLLSLVEAGADLIEVGTPFSDPLADGSTVQHTSQVSLENGTRLRDCVALVKRVRNAGVSIPLMLMGYYNPIVKYGVEQFVADCAEAGVDGFIVPDLPIEESERLRTVARQHNLDLIFMVAPTTTDDRLEQVGQVGTGFVYCVAVTGVTGARGEMSATLAPYMQRVRQHTSQPLAVGFGISTPEAVTKVGDLSDGAIVGSALINYMNDHPDNMPAAAARFVRYLKGDGSL
jgi:tryptophan synthase alpha chain